MDSHVLIRTDPRQQVQLLVSLLLVQATVNVSLHAKIFCRYICSSQNCSPKHRLHLLGIFHPMSRNPKIGTGFSETGLAALSVEVLGQTGGR